MLLQPPLIFYLCVYFLVQESNGTSGYADCKKITFSPLKGQRLGYIFSQKYGSNLTSLQNFSAPWLSHIFSQNVHCCFCESKWRQQIRHPHFLMVEEEEEFFYLIETVGRNQFWKPNRISWLGIKPRYWSMFLPSP